MILQGDAGLRARLVEENMGPGGEGWGPTFPFGGTTTLPQVAWIEKGSVESTHKVPTPQTFRDLVVSVPCVSFPC